MKQQAEAMIPTPWGDFNMVAFSEETDEKMPHIVLVHPEMDVRNRVLVRIHSECLTGDLFSSKRCDCGEQLERALERIGAEKGMVIYLRQEGRGIGIINKLKAYQLQDTGLNTIDANTHLGLEPDARTYEMVLQMLHTFGVSKIKLLTNNPTKVEAFENSDIDVQREPIEIKSHAVNRGYLKTKKEKMGHLLSNPLLD